ncbi:MAG: RHS repeat-associated core domain-containing protein [Leptospirales bacterium]
MGWSLGMGAISRSSRNGEIYYDYRDTFVYQGKRLIKVSGAAGSENGVYRTEIEDGSFIRLNLTDVENGGVWTVEGSGGGKTIFGETIDHRIYRPSDTSKTYSWQFSKSVDLNGNSMYAVYDNSQYSTHHILYLKEIRYTANENTGDPAKLYVRFHLKDRTDFYVSKGPGFIMKMDKLLDKIEMGKDDGGMFGETMLWKYTMEYTISADSNRPLLKTVHSSKNTTSPVFHYQPAEHRFAWKKQINYFASDPETNPKLIKYFEGDVDGDGISDMIFFNPKTGNWKVVESDHTGKRIFKTYGNKFAGYDTEDEIQWFKSNATGDYNGDGKSDIAFYLPKTKEFWVAESRGDRFVFRSYGKLTITDVDIFRAEWFAGDFDGNGISDTVLYDEKTGYWIYMKNEGGSFSFIKFAYNFQNLYRDDYSPALAMSSKNTNDLTKQGRSRDAVKWFRGDYNGDGKTDIGFYDSRDGKWWVAENLRDEKLGFKLQWRLYKVFNAPDRALFSHQQFSGDFNGDGYSDFLLFDREAQRWLLGEVATDADENPTINFRIWSAIPEQRDITRWLQGDFNGDGRTDVGFYSADDNNFWIGEATPSGFRYRIYTNLDSGGPDPARVMQTPAPEDEVEIKKVQAIFPNGTLTQRIEYEYDGNEHDGRGEIVFTGCFTGSCADGPEFLIYDKFKNKFSYKQVNGNITDTSLTFEMSKEKNRFITPTRPYKNEVTGDSEILLYEPDLLNHKFYRIVHNGTFFEKKLFATFTKAGPNITNFDIQKSMYLINDFDADGAPDILVLDDQGSGNLYLYSLNLEILLSNSSSGVKDFKNIFRAQQSGNDRDIRHYYRFFSGDFNGDNTTDILVVDMRQQAQKWYLGTLNPGANSASFSLLSGNIALPPPGFEVSYNELSQNVDLTGAGINLTDSELIYVTVQNGSIVFHRIYVNGNSIYQTDFSRLPAGATFNWDFNHEQKPVIGTAAGIRFIVFGANNISYTIEAQNLNGGKYPTFEINRPDLYTKVYPFQWIQGDYNGDSKTDIGIFHLKESNWYFAMTTGTVPDLIERVDNGIGGFYRFEYANSTSFDNTGVDNIPDLAINYKVCVKQTINDGMGQNVYSKYEYKDGYAWSDFINGQKETDAFGFSIFTTIDPMGAKSINTYYTTPYANYLLNRALGGALKESRFIGSDNNQYSKTQADYLVHEISPGAGKTSYLVYPNETRKYIRNTLISTGTKLIEFSPTEYRLIKSVTTSTDHYQDATHAPFSASAITNFEYVLSTNQQRPVSGIVNSTSAYEVTSYSMYDARGNIVENRVSYTGVGLPNVSDKVITKEYDVYGNVIASEDVSQTPAIRSEMQYETTYNQFPILTRKNTGTMNLDSITQYSYDGPNFGVPTQTTDPNGNSSYIEYDSYGRPIKIKTDTDNGIKTVGRFYYSLSGEPPGDKEFPLSAKTVHYTGTGTNIQSRVWKDGFGRHLHTVQSALDGVANKEFVKTGATVYDALGRVIRTSQTSWAQNREIDVYVPPATEKNTTLTTYDPSGRVKKVKLPPAYAGEPETSIVTNYNDPYEVSVTHSSGRKTTSTKNGRGQALYVEEANINDAAVTTKMGFCYDASGNAIYRQDLNGVTMNCPDEYTIMSVPIARDASGNNATYALYDAFGKIREANDPDMGKLIIEYDGFGRPTFRQDAKGQTSQLTYDLLGRVTTKTLPGAAGTVTYKYDTLSGSANAKGKLVRITDPVQRKSFSYAKTGARKSETRQLRSYDGTTWENSYTTKFTYDLAGRTEKISYPIDPVTDQQVAVCYGYNSFGFAHSVKVSQSNDCSSIDNTVISNMEYDEFGAVTKVDMGNGVSTTFAYDVRGRATRMISTATVDGNTVKHQDVKYTYKINNSIANVVNNPTSADVNGVVNPAFESRYEYTYDGLNRLVEAKGSYGQSGFVNSDYTDTGNQKYSRTYAYAKNGNLTQKNVLDPENGTTTDGWNYTYENHRVTGITSSADGGQRFTMTYDANGNTTSKEDAQKSLTKNMVYDYANRITKIKDQDDVILGEYKYDDQGVRVRKRVQRTIDGQERKLELMAHSKYFVTEKQTLLDGSEITETETAVNNIYLNGIRVATMDSNGSTKYYHANNVDSVKIVTDETGAAISRTEYLPYGETFQREGNLSYAPKYNGQALDQESDLYFFNARHYDPEIARFVTADTVTDGPMTVKGWNRYMYVGGNPIMYKDPTGHAEESGLSGSSSLSSGSREVLYPWEGKGGAGGTDANSGEVKQPPSSAGETFDSSKNIHGGVNPPAFAFPTESKCRNPHHREDNIYVDMANAEMARVHKNKIETMESDLKACKRCGTAWEIDSETYQYYETNHEIAHKLGLLNGFKIINDTMFGGGVSNSYIINVMIPAAGAIVFAPLRAIPFVTQGANNAERIKLYRAMSNTEFDDIMNTGRFNLLEGGFEGKQFGLTYQEVNKFGEIMNADKVLKISVPQKTLNTLEFSNNIDPFIFKNGVYTVPKGKALDLLNKTFQIEGY